MCMSMRGVLKAGSSTVTTHFTGLQGRGCPAGDLPDPRPGLTGAVPLPSHRFRRPHGRPVSPPRSRLEGEPAVWRGRIWMRMRNLGGSGLSVPPICLGTNVFGWTIDEEASFAVLDAASRGRADLHRHRRRVFDLGAGPSGRRIGDHHRALDEGPRQPRRHRPGDQGRRRDGARPQGPQARLHPPRRRGFPAPSADRPHRTLPVAPGRCGDAAGRNARRLRATSSGPARCARSAPRTSAAPG